MKNIKLYLSGFLQVFLVSANTVFLSNLFYVGVFVFGFLISWIWSWNVKKISVSNNIERFSYSIGAASGGLIGVLFSKNIINIFLN